MASRAGHKVRVYQLQPSSSVSLAHVLKLPKKKPDIDVVHLPFGVAVNKAWLAAGEVADAETEGEGQEGEPDDRRHHMEDLFRSGVDADDGGPKVETKAEEAQEVQDPC